MSQIILASQSPRRKELLEQIGLEFEICPAKGEEIITFGKHKGRSVEEVLRKEPSYYDWLMNGDFPAYTKKIFTEIKLRLK